MLQNRFKPGDHEHTYLPLQSGATKTVFEAVDPAEVNGQVGLFRMVEYMYMFCKCGAAPIMVPVTKIKEGQDDKN
jgi:hypothetical protein